jgi:hypothetical protein
MAYRGVKRRRPCRLKHRTGLRVRAYPYRDSASGRSLNRYDLGRVIFNDDPHLSPFDGQGTQSAGAVALRIGAPIEPEPPKGSVTIRCCPSYRRACQFPNSDQAAASSSKEMNALALGSGSVVAATRQRGRR